VASSSDVITRWARFTALGEVKKNARVTIPNNDRVIVDMRGSYGGRDEIFSYGRHFPLATYIQPRGNRPGVFVMNGDRWGGGGWSATNRHQSETRSAIAQVITDAMKKGKRIESILIPFSALNGAGVDIGTIRPLHVREDRSEVIERQSRYLNDVPRHMRTRTEYDTRTASVESLKTNGAPGYTRAAFGSSRRHTYIDLSGSGYFDPEKGEIQTRTVGDIEYRVRVTFPDSVVSPSYAPAGTVWAHWEMIGDDEGNVSWREPREVPAVTPDDSGLYHWTENRHWLGDSLFTAEVSRTETELIVTRSREVADASGGHIGYRSSNIGQRYVIGRSEKTIRTRYRFLSSFDYNEPAPLYFLAALPKSSRAATVEDAYTDLMPRSVAAAIAAGKDVIRQGDIFAIETGLTKEEVYTRSYARSRRSVAQGRGAARPGEIGADLASRLVRIFGTAHTATEVAVTPEGVTYIRGRMYHDSTPRDHVTRVLGDGETWYVTVRNTVPRLRASVTKEIERTADDYATQTATN
jgi:hypothetical protein